MNDKQLLRWFGVLILISGLTRMGMTPSALLWGTDSTQELAFGIIACILMSVASIGLFLAQRESGILGLLSSLLLMVFNAGTACMVWTLLASGQTGEQLLQDMGSNTTILLTKMIVMAGMLIGTPLFTYATFRAKVFPRWVVYLLLLSVFGPILPYMEKWGAFFWGLSYVGIGIVMVREAYIRRQSASTASASRLPL